MRSVIKKSVLFAGAFLALAGGTAHANISTVLQVKVPFPFVVAGQNFPAGKYLVERDDMTSPVLLIRGEDNTHAATFMMTMPADGRDPAGSTPAVSFTRRENQYRLSTVWLSREQGEKVVKR